MSSLTSNSADRTREIGAALAHAVSLTSTEHAVVIALNGELGAGKTTLVSGFLRALGIEGPIRSPTYTLIEPYELGVRTVYHLDLYRLSSARDLEMLAPRDLLNPGAVLLVEWATRGGLALPTPDLTVNLKYAESAAGEAQRVIEVSPTSTTGKGLADSLEG
jgi:tRNA threonylcarbamoyladenosine biosynthesis protein TsaE